MDTRRFNDHEWKALLTTLLRDATRRQDWRAVEQAVALLGAASLSDEMMRILLQRIAIEFNEQRMATVEAAYRDWTSLESFDDEEATLEDIERFWMAVTSTGTAHYETLRFPYSSTIHQDPSWEPYVEYYHGALDYSTSVFRALQARVTP